MKPWETLGTATTPDGFQLTLRKHDNEFVLRADGYDLMVSRMHGSEESLAELAMGAPGSCRSVLVGGLGMGYTLRAALDRLAPGGTVTVAEIVPEVITWNRGPLAHLADQPLDDPRTQVFEGDVSKAIRAADGLYDAILLDVDNGPGPDALTQRLNGWLYAPAGLSAIHRALTPRGVLAIWSVGEAGQGFERQLARAGFVPEMRAVPSRPGSRGRGFLVFLGRKGVTRPRPAAARTR